MLESALRIDFLGRHLSLMEANVTKDWGKRWREINKKDALPVSSIMFNNVLKLYILFLIKNKYFSKKAPCVVRHKRAVLR